MLHYQKRKEKNPNCKKQIIRDMLEEGYSVDEIIQEHGYNRKYVLDTRFNLGLAPTRRRSPSRKKEEPEGRSLAPELKGEYRKRYLIVKAFREHCQRCRIEWSMEGLLIFEKHYKINKHSKKDSSPC